MIKRLGIWLLAIAVSLDQLAHVLLAGPKFLIIGGPTPNPDETISGIVGRMAIKGKRWALVTEHMIDAVFGRGHCREMAEKRA